MTRPLRTPPPRVRQRKRSDGAWSVWWEPETALRALGFEPVALDPGRLTWSVREAERLNALVDQARGGPQRPVGGREARGRSVAALIRRYRQSPFWDALKPATQRSYGKLFRAIEAKWGSSLVGDFSKPIVYAWYETLYKTGKHHQAAALIRALSLLMAYAELIGWRQDNPCARLKLRTPKGRHRVSDWSELDALFAACADLGLPSMGLAIALATFQGQRQTDLIEARCDHVAVVVVTERDRKGKPILTAETPFAIVRGGGELARFEDGLGREVVGGVWRFVRSKRGNHGGMALSPEVLPWLARRRLSADPALIAYEGTGRAYAADLFRKKWGLVRAAAAKANPSLRSLQFRDLRRTFGHLARLGGASERDVADAIGNNAWKDPQLSGVYMPANSDTASRAVAAIARPKGVKG